MKDENEPRLNRQKFRFRFSLITAWLVMLVLSGVVYLNARGHVLEEVKFKTTFGWPYACYTQCSTGYLFIEFSEEDVVQFNRIFGASLS